MMEAIRRLFGKRHKPIPERRAKPYKPRRAKKPVPVETPEEAEAKEVKRRMAEEERKRNNDLLFGQLREKREKPATREDARLENAQRIIISAARYTEDDKEKERLKELHRRILADVRREAEVVITADYGVKEEEIG